VEAGGGTGYQSGDDRDVFTWTVTTAGLATLLMIDQIDHASAVERNEPSGSATNDDDQEESKILNLTAVLEVKDKDLDVVSLDADFARYSVEDDMPDIGDSGANVASGEDIIANKVINFAAGSGNGETTSLEAVIGTDENIIGGGVTITDYNASIVYAEGLTLLGELSANKKVVSYYEDKDGSTTFNTGDVEYFRLTIDDSDSDSTNWTYEWEALQDPPNVEAPVNFNAIKSGGPQELLSPPVGSGGLVAVFDGLLFNTADAALNWTPGAVLDPVLDQSHDGILDLLASDQDDGNPDAEGFGIKQPQASQFNHNEGFYATLFDTGTTSFVEMSSLSFGIEGIGAPTTFHLDWRIMDDGVVVGSDSDTILTLSGNAEIPYSIALASGDSFDSVYVRTWWDDAPTNKGVRLLDFSIGLPQPTEDQALDWEVTIEDFDGDTDVATFRTGIDGTLDIRRRHRRGHLPDRHRRYAGQRRRRGCGCRNGLIGTSTLAGRGIPAAGDRFHGLPRGT
jgi:hypothetical protein